MPENTQTRAVSEVYEAIFRTTSDGVFVLHPNYTVAEMNPAAAAMFNLKPEEVIGTHPLQKFSGNRALLSLFTDKEDQTLDVRLPRKRTAIGSTVTFPDKTRVILLKDVTEARSIDERRDNLIKAIAHDLRNPIAAVGGFADLIARFGELNDYQIKYLNRVKQTTTKLHDMVALLVDLAWIEAGMPQKHVPVRLTEVIENTVDSLTSLAQKNQIRIVISVQKPLPIVMGDPERFQMAIFHLLQNAILYSYPESNVAIHAWSAENKVYCSVADCGFGISEDELEMIFDRMYRSRDERVIALPGGGIGLTLARTIIRRHGGEIHATSQLGEGSTFTFTLPSIQL